METISHRHNIGQHHNSKGNREHGNGEREKGKREKSKGKREEKHWWFVFLWWPHPHHITSIYIRCDTRWYCIASDGDGQHTSYVSLYVCSPAPNNSFITSGRQQVWLPVPASRTFFISTTPKSSPNAGPEFVLYSVPNCSLNFNTIPKETGEIHRRYAIWRSYFSVVTARFNI